MWSIKGLFCEGNSNKVSIGRVLLWIVFGFMCSFWFISIKNNKVLEMPESLFNFAFVLLMYNLGKKVRDILQLLIQLKYNNQNQNNNLDNINIENNIEELGD